MKIAFISARDPKSVKTWSGIHFFIGKAFEKQGHQVDYLGPHKPLIRFLLKFLNKFSKKEIDIGKHPLMAKAYAKFFGRKLKNKNYDFIFAPAASTEIAYLKTSIPIVYTSDATFAALQNYYTNFSAFTTSSNHSSNHIEKSALENATFIVYPSQWAANSAKKDYSISPSKIHVFPYGANIFNNPNFPNRQSPAKGPKLLFLGNDWERKGGKIAYDTFLELQRLGFTPELTICGTIPPVEINQNHIRVIDFLDKSKPEDFNKFMSIMNESHFLILPTSKECYGIVFCEASAYGLPSLSFNTGGVSGAIKEGINGYLLPLNSTYKDFANKILEISTNEGVYEKLSESSYAYYKSELDWINFSDKIINLILKSKN